MCSQGHRLHSQVIPWLSPNLLVLPELSPLLPGASEGHCVGPVNTGIKPPWDSGPTILKYSQRFLVGVAP